MSEVVEGLTKLLSDPTPLTLVGLAIVCLTVALVVARQKHDRQPGNDATRQGCGVVPSTRRPLFGASMAQAPRTRSTPLVVWQASAGHRSNEPTAG